MRPSNGSKLGAAIATLTLSFTPMLPATARASQPDTAARVQLPQGEIEGLTTQSGTKKLNVFRGIPYAAAPVGEYRWREPQPVARWSGVRQATRFSPRCMQLARYPATFRSAAMSEDCLYLNVWAPAENEREKLPVLVYLHGGGFSSGDGSEPRYDGAQFASRGIVTVTVNYRLGVFGFLAHPDAASESPSGVSGNYGLLDQQAALRWVRENIARFGGDPERITLGGAGAGAIAVNAHMASPLSRGLFARAFGQSGGAFARSRPWSRTIAEDTSRQYADAVQAGSLRALRELSADKLLEATGPASKPRFPFRPHIDGYFLTDTPESVFRAGAQAKVPLLLGTNAQEKDARVVLDPAAATPENWRETMRSLFLEHADEALVHYPGANPSEIVRSSNELAVDVLAGHSTWRWMDLHRLTGGTSVYLYRYAHSRPSANGASEASSPAMQGADIEYALGNLGLVNERWQPADHEVSNTFSGYLEHFIKTGDPNGRAAANSTARFAGNALPLADALPVWPAVASGRDGIARQTIDTRTVTDHVQLDARHSFLERFFAAPLDD